MKIKVALAEDNNLLAESIIEKMNLFEDEIEFRFRGKNGKDLIDKLDEDHNLDVILMDIEMPEMNGIEATSIIKKKYPQIKVIMLTVFDDENNIFDAITAGAMGYILKDENPGKLIESIKTVVQGGAPMSPSIAMNTLKILRDPERLYNDNPEDFNLSEREVDVLKQIAEGLGYKEIAENLFISPFTVKKHIENIYRKLQVNNKVSAVRKAARNKII
ncbi:MAG: DNA-binding response regulator [Ignavibacteria bacterium]|nr:MAG: DNA-binding response regulator [Ignavibacteria bacterium]